MTRIRPLAAAFALVAALAAGGLAGAPARAQSALQDVLSSGVLKVGTTGDWNPMTMKDVATNSYTGYDIDVMNALAADLGVTVEFVPTDWKTLVNGILADKYDITTSASLNVPRAKVAGFSDPYVQFGTVPMTLRANADRFDGWDSINDPDVKVAVTLGTVFEQQARQFFPDATIVAVESPARDFQEVLAGRATVSITSNVEAASLMETYPELVTIRIDQARSRRPGAFLVSQDDQVWINFLNHWITLNRENGVFAELQEKWRISN